MKKEIEKRMGKKLFPLLLLLLLAATQVLAGDLSKCENVPNNIVNQIKSDVAGRYPNNFTVQLTLINGQCEAYKDLQQWQPPVPPDVYKKIKEDITSRYPNSYTVQMTLIKAQCESYQQLH